MMSETVLTDYSDDKLTVSADGDIGYVWNGDPDQLDNPPVNGVPIVVPDDLVVLD